MIYKRGLHWHMDVTVQGVRYREALKTTDRREALRLEKRRVGEIQQGKGASKAGRKFARLPFKLAAEQFLQDRRLHTAERTQQLEKERMRPLIRYFGEKTLLRITAGDISSYQSDRSASVANRTVNMEVGLLRRMMRRAKVWSVVAEDVRFLPEKGNVIGRALTAEQKAHLFKTAGLRPEWLVAHCAAVLAVSTTCRGVELKHLQWRDVDLFGRTMRILRSKTEAGHRILPLNTDAMNALARLRDRAEKEGSAQPEHFVFPACENGKIQADKPQKTWRTAWRSLVRKAASLAGQSAAAEAERIGGNAEEARRCAEMAFSGFRFHDLRHTAITELAEAGAADATIMSLAGHLSPEMLEHYSHVRMQAKRSALDALASGLIAPTVAHRSDASKAVN